MSKNLCVECGRRIGVWNKKLKRVGRSTLDHDLCQKCWQAEIDRNRKFKCQTRTNAGSQDPES